MGSNRATSSADLALATHETLKTLEPIAPNSDLWRAQATLATALDDTKKATPALQAAYYDAVERADVLMKVAETAKVAANKKYAAAAQRADSLKAAATRAIDIRNKTLAAQESLKLALEVSNNVVAVKGKNYRTTVL